MGSWLSVIFIDLDGTILRGPFKPAVFPTVFAELAAKTGLEAAELRRLVTQENLARQSDPAVPAVLAMDWDDILSTVARRLGVELEAKALEIVRTHAGPPYAAILDRAGEVLRQLAGPERALVAATKGLRKYQLPVLDALGLSPLFADILTPDSHQALKADRAFFGDWPERAPLQVMVGDHYEDDVLAPQRFGFRTVWKVNVQKAPGLQPLGPLARPSHYPYTEDQPARPDAIILSLSELPPVIAHLEAQYAHSEGTH